MGEAIGLIADILAGILSVIYTWASVWQARKGNYDVATWSAVMALIFVVALKS